MNRKQLKYFMEVYKYRNIQMAANNLFISHQGLSRVIGSLEAELGEKLFIRSNRGLEPTDFALTLLPHIQMLIDDYEHIEGIRTLAGQKKSVVTIYSIDHVLGYLGADFVMRFHELHPDITLSVVDTTDECALDAIQNGSAQFAIINGPIDNTRFLYEKLFYSRYCFRINKNNPLAAKPELTAEDFNMQKLIGKGRAYKCFRSGVDKLILAENIHVELPVETSDERLTQELVERNLGIAVTYEFSAIDYCGANTTIRYIDDPAYGQDIYLAQSRNFELSKTQRVFRGYLLGWCENMNRSSRRDGAN